jgi:transcriptional regulator with XRE-family HTH domain
MKTEIATLRSKKIGVLLKQMRENQGQAVEACANWLGLDTISYQAIEDGDQCASLPQIESLAYFLDFPFELFTFLPVNEQDSQELSPRVNQELLNLRNKTIAILIKQKREELGLSLNELATEASVSVDEIGNYESGTTPIPFSELPSLLDVLQFPLDQLYSHDGPLQHKGSKSPDSGASLSANLSEEMVKFISTPANLPYIELAMRISKMDANKIRTIASNLLEITY